MQIGFLQEKFSAVGDWINHPAQILVGLRLQVLVTAAPERAKFLGNDSDHGLWKFSVILGASMSADSAAASTSNALIFSIYVYGIQ